MIDISKEQYDWLLRWYEREKEDALLGPLEDTFAKANRALSQINESTTQPKAAKSHVQNPYPPAVPVGFHNILIFLLLC